MSTTLQDLTTRQLTRRSLLPVTRGVTALAVVPTAPNRTSDPMHTVYRRPADPVELPNVQEPEDRRITKARQVIVLEMKDDTRRELETLGIAAYLVEQFETMPFVPYNDPIVDEIIAFLNVSPGSTVDLTNDLVDGLAVLVHSRVQSTLNALGAEDVTFELTESYCDRTERGNTATTIIQALGGTIGNYQVTEFPMPHQA